MAVEAEPVAVTAPHGFFFRGVLLPFLEPRKGGQTSAEGEEDVDREGEVGDPLVPEVIDEFVLVIIDVLEVSLHEDERMSHEGPNEGEEAKPEHASDRRLGILGHLSQFADILFERKRQQQSRRSVLGFVASLPMQDGRETDEDV